MDPPNLWALKKIREDFLQKPACHPLLVVSVACNVGTYDQTVLSQNLPTSKKIMWISQWEGRKGVGAQVNAAPGSSALSPHPSANPPQPGHPTATCSFRKSMQFPFPFCFTEMLKQEILALFLHILLTAKLSESTSSTCMLVLLKWTKGNVILQAGS